MDKFTKAQEVAAAARARLASAPCTCGACVTNNNLPAVQRILEAAKRRMQ